MTKHLSGDQLISYVCRTLTDAQREKMDIHLGICQDCRGRLAGYETLHRRLRYSVIDWRRGVSPSPHMTFAAVAPQLRRSRKFALVWTGSKQFVYGAATLAVLVLLVVGLALFFGGVHVPLPGPSPQPLPPDTYKKLITMEDIAADEWAKNYGQRDYMFGQQELTLAEGNRYSIISIWPGPLPAVFQVGSYTLTSERIVFTAEEGHCAGTDAQVGTYQWTFDGKDLTLKVVEDQCYGRKFFHTVYPWSRIEYERPLGTYAVTIAQEDVPTNIRDDLRAALPGRWELTLDGEGYFSVAHDGTTVSEGRYTLAQGVLSLDARQGDCTGVGETGHYQWALDGTVLTLTAVEDWCETRNAVFTLRPLAKVEVSEAAPVLRLGNYVTTITLEDIDAEESMKYSVIQGSFSGEWQLTLGEGNRYTYLVITDEKWPAVIEEGHYTITPDQMVFTAEEGASCSRTGEGVATYQWTLDGDTLTMNATEQEDPCLYRRFVFTTHSWSKVEYELPPGLYSITVVEADIPAAVPGDLRAALPGLWELEILEDGHFSLAHAGVSVSRGRYQLTQKLMTLTADQGECTGLGEGGIYQWAFDGQALSLTAVQDWCDKRNAVLTLRPLTRSGAPKVVAEPEVAATLASSVTLESLAGLWQDTEHGVYLQLDADGTFRSASSVAWLEASPLDIGQFRLEGTLLTFSTFSYNTDSQWCMHQQGSYFVELTQPGELRFELKEDPCQSRASKLPAGRWVRVEP